MFFPFKLKRLIYINFFNWDVSSDSKIGFSFIDARYVYLNDGAIIKSMTVIKGLDAIILGKNSRIGTLNWLSGKSNSNVDLPGLLMLPNKYSVIEIGDESAITNRHYIDCTSSISIGKFTTFAGVKSTMMTHSIDVYKSSQGSSSISIGSYCFIGTDSTILGGAYIPDYCIVGAKSLVIGMLADKYKIYGGVPARELKSLPVNLPYFKRNKGVVK